MFVDNGADDDRGAIRLLLRQPSRLERMSEHDG
jgi:hypothetical protein